MFVCLCVCEWVIAWLCKHNDEGCVLMHGCVYIHIWMYTYGCVYKSMCLCVYSYVGVHTCVFTVAYMCGHIHMLCVCVC